MEIVIDTSAACKNKNGEFDFNLKNQLKKSAVSIVSNIAEGFERETNNEYLRFLYYSKGSAGELRCHFRVASRLGFIALEESKIIELKIEKLSRMISNLIKVIKL
jgi:four helix bundle protein